MPFDGSSPVCSRNYPDSCYLLVGLSSLIHQLQLKEVQNETPSQIWSNDWAFDVSVLFFVDDSLTD